MIFFKILRDTLLAYEEGQVPYKEALEQLKEQVGERDTALAHRYFKGVLERMKTLEGVLDTYSNMPLSKYNKAHLLVMLIGIYGLLFMRQADYAIINGLVELVKEEMTGLTPMTNGILRNIARNKDKIKLPKDDAEIHKDLLKALKKDYSQEEIDVYLKKMNEPVSMEILSMIDQETLQSKLLEEGFMTERVQCVPYGLRVEKSQGLFESNAFKDGLFYVQSFASQLAAGLITHTEGGRILDIASSPGGKTIAMNRYMPGNTYWMNDVSKEKLLPIKENLKRLQLEVEGLSVWDARKHQYRWKNAFDVVFLDAPCSGSGIMARNVEIRKRRDHIELTTARDTQRRIFHESSRYVKKNGFLIYCSCSILNRENQEQVEYFLDTHKEFKRVPLDGPFTKDGYFVTNPMHHDMDGFFAAVLKRES